MVKAATDAAVFLTNFLLERELLVGFIIGGDF
jgi:hypothetical protein